MVVRVVVEVVMVLESGGGGEVELEGEGEGSTCSWYWLRPGRLVSWGSLGRSGVRCGCCEVR